MNKPNVDGEWTIESIDMAPRSKRTQIWVTNQIVRVKFLLNWKNPSKDDEWKDYPAKLGLVSTSWNVWIRKKK